MAQAPRLSRRRILVVEDEYLLADELRRELEAAGAVVIGPVPTVEGALVLLEGEVSIDAALLDVNLGGEMVFPVAEALVVRSVPFVFTSGYDDNVLAEHYSLMPRCQKPADITSIIDQLTMILPAWPLLLADIEAYRQPLSNLMIANLSVLASMGHRWCSVLRRDVVVVTLEEANRLTLGWSREHLARVSGVDTASVYLLERMGSAGPDDDLRIRNALAGAKAQMDKNTSR